MLSRAGARRQILRVRLRPRACRRLSETGTEMRRLARVFEPPKVDLQPAWEKTLRDAEKLHGKYQRVVSGEAAAEAKQALQAKVPVARCVAHRRPRPRAARRGCWSCAHSI